MNNNNNNKSIDCELVKSKMRIRTQKDIVDSMENKKWNSRDKNATRKKLSALLKTFFQIKSRKDFIFKLTMEVDCKFKIGLMKFLVTDVIEKIELVDFFYMASNLCKENKKIFVTGYIGVGSVTGKFLVDFPLYLKQKMYPFILENMFQNIIEISAENITEEINDFINDYSNLSTHKYCKFNNEHLEEDEMLCRFVDFELGKKHGFDLSSFDFFFPNPWAFMQGVKDKGISFTSKNLSFLFNAYLKYNKLKVYKNKLILKLIDGSKCSWNYNSNMNKIVSNWNNIIVQMRVIFPYQLKSINYFQDIPITPELLLQEVDQLLLEDINNDIEFLDGNYSIDEKCFYFPFKSRPGRWFLPMNFSEFDIDKSGYNFYKDIFYPMSFNGNNYMLINKSNMTDEKSLFLIETFQDSAATVLSVGSAKFFYLGGGYTLKWSFTEKMPDLLNKAVAFQILDEDSLFLIRSKIETIFLTLICK